MPTTLQAAAEAYLRARHLSPGTQAEYRSTLRKWNRWGGAIPIETMSRKNLREFLDWVFEQAVREDDDNPGRTANKARENLRAIVSWAWEHDLIQAFPRFPKPKPQRDVAGLHYLAKSELNALYFATHRLRNPPGWTEPFPLGKYWRCALVVFSITVSPRGRFGRPLPCTSRYSGGMCHGISSVPEAAHRLVQGGGGFSNEG